MLSARAKHAASLTLFLGIGAQVSGFLLHAVIGQPGPATDRQERSSRSEARL